MPFTHIDEAAFSCFFFVSSFLTTTFSEVKLTFNDNDKCLILVSDFTRLTNLLMQDKGVFHLRIPRYKVQ